ncbi:uncharacterized protein LOC121642799 [Melanotaenia boesemani]|uniref:uncharacterized protein LOC121642799 n=1 Tax=Melanotaenia boesemani TaxID=1250792 RepID=UPI001C058731|nr:uncharacterized protein LOC121642799 [Melanotaenia boesemani]
MDEGASTSVTPEQKSAVERAIRSFVDVLSNVRSEVGGETVSRQSSQPPAGPQTTRENTLREMQRSFPAMFQRRQNRGKRPFPAPSVVIPAARHVELSFCLLPGSTTKTPKNEIKLLQAGLGRRTIGIADNADHEQITKALHGEYPKMKTLTGGWLLYKSAGGNGQRNLSVVAQGSQGYTSKMLKMATSNGKHMLYIVPLQEEIDTTPLPHDAAEFRKMPKSQCKNCGLNMPLQLLVNHIESCGQESDFDDIPEQAPHIEPVISTEVQVQPSCPVCGKQFSREVLMLHASTCGESVMEDLPTTSRPQGGAALSSDGDDLSAASLCEVTGHEVELWKNVSSPQEAATLFKKYLMREKENEPPIMASIDIRDDQTSQSRDILAFYKRPKIDWTRPFHCLLQGDTAVGIGVQRHFLSLAMLKLQHGFNINSGVADTTLLFEGQQDHLIPCTSRILVDSDLFLVAGRMIGHSFLNDGPRLHGLSDAIVHMLLHANRDTVTVKLEDVPDLDIRTTIQMLDGDKPLSEEQKNEVNTLAISWDLPPVNTENRKWLLQQLLHHAVIGRTIRQTKQIRKGLKDTRLWNLLQDRPETAPIIFPRHAESILTVQAVLSHIVWPGDDSDDDDDDAPYTLRVQNEIAGFLRTFIETATPLQLSQLVKFWVGWEIPTGQMKVEVVKADYLSSSTCFATLRVPGHFHEYSVFSKHVDSCIGTYATGFGLI